jgi:hypothetical protein
MRTIKESIVSSVGAGKEKIIKNILKKIYKQACNYFPNKDGQKFDALNNEIFVGDVVLYDGEITHASPLPIYVESLTPTNNDYDYILCWNPCDDKLYNIFCPEVVKIFNVEKYLK